MKSKIFKTGALALTAVLLSFNIFTPTARAATKTTTTTTTTTTTKPVFGSSFIQYWYAQDWDQARWTSELTMLQNIGINEIILQDVVDTKAKYAAYSTSLAGYTHNDIDMLQNALTAADALNMKVRVGLGFNGDWWSKNASDMTWLNTEAAANKAIFDEIFAKYGNHTSLGGWYIPYEFSQFTATTSTTKANFNSFLKQIGTEIRSKDASRSIMISPFYNSKSASLFSTLSSWTTTVQTVLKDTKINIVALQDSVGAGYNTLSQVANVFSYTKKATDALAIALYADTETYTSTSTGNVTAPQSRISSQLSAEKTYVKGFVAFSIDHYQNNNETGKPEQVQGYNDYYNYYLANK